MMEYKQIKCIFFLSLMLLGCSDDNKDLIQYIKEVKYRKTHEIEHIPSFISLPIFEFLDNDSRRSPFKPIRSNEQIDLNTLDLKRPKEPLEAFPLEALKFVGTLRKGTKIWALIEKPSKEISYVTVGSYIGKNDGRIISIGNDLLQLIEKNKNFVGFKKRIIHWRLGYALF